MEHFASSECMEEEKCECEELIGEYLEEVEEQVSNLKLSVDEIEQQVSEPISPDDNVQVMLTYAMHLEEELDAEKQNNLRLQKLQQEAENDRLEIEERYNDLAKLKCSLEKENQELRQKLWKLKEAFRKGEEQLWDLQKQNRKLQEILEIKENSNDRRGSDNILLLRRYEELNHMLGKQQQENHTMPQRWSHTDGCPQGDEKCYNGASRSNIQRFSSQHLPCNDDNRKEQRNLLQDFVMIKQAQQGKKADDNNCTHLEGKMKNEKNAPEASNAKQIRAGAEQLDTREESESHAKTNDKEEQAKPSNDLFILLSNLDKRPESKPKHEREKVSDFKNLEDRNSNLTKALQRLEMQHSELKSQHDRLSKMLNNNLKRQEAEDEIFMKGLKKNISKRKVRTGVKEETLLQAVKGGSVIRVMEAISEGADVNLALWGKWTPLHLAAAFGRTSICEKLLDAGAMRNPRDRWEDTPLHWAAVNGHQEVAELLVNRGADISRLGRGGKTPREKALGAGYEELANWFAKEEQDRLKRNRTV